MKTVIQIVQHLRPGGIETMALDLMKFCEQHENALIISLEGQRDAAIRQWPRLRAFDHQLIFLDKKPGIHPLLVLTLRRLFKQLKADVIHSHHIGPLLYGGIAARLAGVRCLLHTEHDAWHLNSPRRCTLLRRLVALLRPSLVADADAVADEISRRLNGQQVRVIRNGIDTARFVPGKKTVARARLKLPEQVHLIGCSGRLEKVKGQRFLIEAMNFLPDDVHLVLAGSGSTENRLRHQVRQLKLDNRVHFLGSIDTMNTFYQALDLFCLPSLNEGLPLSPLEAQACNIPAAVTDVGGARETLCPDSGVLLPPGNAVVIASRLQQMLGDGQRAAPRQFVRQQGDVRLMAKSYANLRYTGA